MGWIDGWAVHERTATHDGLDLTGTTELDRFSRDTAVSERPVEPDVSDVLVECLLRNSARN